MDQVSLRKLYIAQLQDLLDSENQLIKAIPRMAEKATSEDLGAGFQEHWKQTKVHAKRVAQILEALGENTKREKCKGMQGLIAEGGVFLRENYEGDLLDSALISAAQRFEHYEIASYGCVREYGQLLGENESVSLLSKTLEEEQETDQKLTELALRIHQNAAKEFAAQNVGSNGPDAAKRKAAEA